MPLIARSCRDERTCWKDALVNDRRSADELRAVAEPAWSKIEMLIEGARSVVQVLDADESRRDVALEAIQVTTGSFLGAVVGHCGALLVDHSWLRVLGAGADGIPGVHEANRLTGVPPPLLVVAWDVLGGRFAVNGGGLAGEPGEVFFWAPDTLDWMGLGFGYGAFIAWALSDQLPTFYSSLRWPGWEAEVSAILADQGLSVFPPPFTAEGRDLSRASRRAIPMAELHVYLADVAQRVQDLPEGASFRLHVKE